MVGPRPVLCLPGPNLDVGGATNIRASCRIEDSTLLQSSCSESVYSKRLTSRSIPPCRQRRLVAQRSSTIVYSCNVFKSVVRQTWLRNEVHFNRRNAAFRSCLLTASPKHETYRDSEDHRISLFLWPRGLMIGFWPALGPEWSSVCSRTDEYQTREVRNSGRQGGAGSVLCLLLASCSFAEGPLISSIRLL